jgi:hypothetical protein
MLNSSNESTGILNPDTYLNHLSPAEGFEVQIRGDIAIVIFGVRDLLLPWLDLISYREGGFVGCVYISLYRHKDSERKSV